MCSVMNCDLVNYLNATAACLSYSDAAVVTAAAAAQYTQSL